MSHTEIRFRLRLRAAAARSRALVLDDCARLARFLHWGVPASEVRLSVEEIAEVHVDAVRLATKGGEAVVTH